MPKITVITPTYNRANFLKETIESIISQNFIDFEYFILDDGSSDNTEELVKPYLSDSRLKYIKKENSGEADTVNYGWRMANGEYFTQVNSDDPILPGLFFEMADVLDKDPDKVVAFPDFNIIDENNHITSVTQSPDWNFESALKQYSCYAASPGNFIRRESFKNWKKLKRLRFKHINDVEMYWDMALVGDFIHVPKILATWRIHSGQISNERYKSIPEIEEWFKYYFNQNLPNNIANLKSEVRKSIIDYFIFLIKISSLNLKEKRKLAKPYKKERGEEIFSYANLQIGDNDLIGNKFNGHDLHLYLREKNVESFHIVSNKESEDEYTYVYDLNSSEPFNISLIKNELFINSDVIHLHLIHNTPFDLTYLPLITKLKPTVWTLHDPWALSGHCIYHFECEKWMEHCRDCPKLEIPQKKEIDDTYLQFELKKQAIQNSDISLIVASKWMEKKVKLSPIFNGKAIYRLPFGIDQNLFSPISASENRKKHNIDKENFVMMFRSDFSPYKGLEMIKYALNNINSGLTIITVGQKGLLNDFKDKFKIIEFGWLKEDKKMVELYQACDLFVMPAKQEAFEMMAIEAMSCGKLVLSIKGTSLEEITNAPECGIATEPDKKIYAKELQRLINSPDEVKNRGQKSLEFAKKNYNKVSYIDSMLKIYSEVMNKHKLEETYNVLQMQMQKYCITPPIPNNKIQTTKYLQQDKHYIKAIENHKKEIEDHKKEIEDCKKEIEDCKKEVETIKNSWSYRIGKATTKAISAPFDILKNRGNFRRRDERS